MKLLETWRAEVAVIKSAPWSFAACVVASALAIWGILQYVYEARIAAKDATIQAKESERDRYRADVDRLEKEMDRAIPLKKRGEVLSKQILEYSIRLATNDGLSMEYFNRFEGRVKRFVEKADELGYPCPTVQRAFTEALTAETAKAIAVEIAAVAEKLKDD